VFLLKNAEIDLDSRGERGYNERRRCVMSRLQEIIDGSKYAVFFGGAGVSTASNIPDFRGKNGIYNTENRFKIPPEAIISHSFFVNRTKDFYEYYRDNMLYPEAKPNEVHKALARLEAAGKIKAVITQNIDNLHQRAGSKKVFELHGSVHRNYCTDCGKFFGLDKILGSKGIPICECGGIIKPDVVLYEEGLDDKIWSGAVKEIDRADTLIVGGSSLTVMPAAYLVDCFSGKNLVIVNGQPTPYDKRATLVLNDDLTEVFKNLK
jgi:NAD-dependent protein deacetylases, SIR2 family